MPDSDLTRRNLLISGGLLAAAALPSMAATPLAPPDKQPEKLDVPTAQKKAGWAIMGLGELALQQVLPAFGACERSRPVALVSGHPDKARKVAEAYGIDPKNIYGYGDYDKIQGNPAVDVIYNILPNHMHAEYTVRGFKAGKHVLCEKPMAPTTKECEEMIAAGKSAGKQLMIAYRLHYEPTNLKAVELLRGGGFGKIKFIEATNSQNTYPPNIRLSRETAGGPLVDVGIYCLNACRYLTGEEPVEVSGLLHQPPGSERFAEVPESIIFTLRFPSGAMAMCACGFGTGRSDRFRVHCDKGYVELDPAFRYQGLKLRTEQDNIKSEHTMEPKDHFTQEMDHFSDCVLSNKPNRSPGEEGLRDMVIIAKINEAIREGRTIQL
ncbi:MAG TPA: Gfo/Idh/MocA family oxidoreductase [Tepidisphaeraceae bacterium]|jgi:predicted dehydrogenase